MTHALLKVFHLRNFLMSLLMRYKQIFLKPFQFLIFQTKGSYLLVTIYHDIWKLQFTFSTVIKLSVPLNLLYDEVALEGIFWSKLNTLVLERSCDVRKKLLKSACLPTPHQTKLWTNQNPVSNPIIFVKSTNKNLLVEGKFKNLIFLFPIFDR